MLSTNSGEFVDFDLIFKDLDVQADEDPNMVIYHTIKTKTGRSDLFIKITGIRYNVQIYEILKNGVENLLINLGNTYSHVHSFFSTHGSTEPTDRSVLIKFPINKFSRIIESRLINGKFLFKIDCIMDYEIYFYNQGCYFLKQAKQSPPTFRHSPQTDFIIKPTDDQISSIIRKNKYINVLRTDLELLDQQPINNPPLSEAVNNLKLAAEGYIKGEFNTVIINVRNALLNDLTEKVVQKNEKRTVLKTIIKNACLSKIPTKDKEDYEEILNYVGRILASLIDINNKYAHENQNTIRMRPLHTDLQLLYFSAALLTKYLTSLNNNKI